MNWTFAVFKPSIYWHHLKASASFFLKPKFYDQPADWKEALGVLPVLLVLKLLLSIAAALSFYAFEASGMVSGLENKLGALEWPVWQLILAGGLIVPMIEESTFRAHFRMSRLSLAATLAGLSYLMVSAFLVGDRGLREGLFEDGAAERFLFAFFIGLIIYFGAKKGAWMGTLAQIWQRWFSQIFWISIILFGASHLERYANFSWSEHGLFVPLIILPQIVAATFYTYTRMRYGFGWAVALHGINNALPIVIFDVLITGPIDAISF